MNNKERERIVKELREQGIVPTDDRLAILKEKIEDRNTPSRDRFRRPYSRRSEPICH